MKCYFTNRQPLVTSNTWIKLPGYISKILGFSKTTGLTYFKKDLQFFSSSNGLLFEMATPDDIPFDMVRFQRKAEKK